MSSYRLGWFYLCVERARQKSTPKPAAAACYVAGALSCVAARDCGMPRARADSRGSELARVSVPSVPDYAARFGFLAQFVGLDMAASSAITRERLGWEPTGPTLI